MNIKYSNQFLRKLEELIGETDHILRYEKGNFRSGWCILKDTRIIIVNKFFTKDGKINALMDIIKTINIDPDVLSEKNKKLYQELSQTELEL